MAACALPRVEPDVVMVAAGRDKCSGRAESRYELKAKDSAVKRKCAVKVGDLEVDVADTCSGWDRHGNWINEVDFGCCLRFLLCDLRAEEVTQGFASTN